MEKEEEEKFKVENARKNLFKSCPVNITDKEGPKLSRLMSFFTSDTDTAK